MFGFLRGLYSVGFYQRYAQNVKVIIGIRNENVGGNQMKINPKLRTLLLFVVVFFWGMFTMTNTRWLRLVNIMAFAFLIVYVNKRVLMLPNDTKMP